MDFYNKKIKSLRLNHDGHDGGAWAVDMNKKWFMNSLDDYIPTVILMWYTCIKALT